MSVIYLLLAVSIVVALIFFVAFIVSVKNGQYDDSYTPSIRMLFDDEIVKVCNDLANRGVRVIVAGLDMDFKGNPFGPMPALMATAEYVTKVHAVCTRTGNLANYSYRKAKSDELVLLGEVDEYEPLSRSAYYKLMLREKVRNINVKDAEDISKKKEA